MAPSMRVSAFHSVLLVLVLTFGQWLNLAHASKHEPLSGSERTCEYCVHAQGLGAGLADLPRLSAPSLLHEAPRAPIHRSVSVAAPAHYPIRGPPLSLV